jgi:hypothetical protein
MKMAPFSDLMMGAIRSYETPVTIYTRLQATTFQKTWANQREGEGQENHLARASVSKGLQTQRMSELFHINVKVYQQKLKKN